MQGTMIPVKLRLERLSSTNNNINMIKKQWTNMSSREKSQTIDDISEALSPEVNAVIDLASKDLATKDGYGIVLHFLTPYSSQPFFIKAGLIQAFVKGGYSSDTLGDVTNILGWQAV